MSSLYGREGGGATFPTANTAPSRVRFRTCHAAPHTCKMRTVAFYKYTGPRRARQARFGGAGEGGREGGREVGREGGREGAWE